MRYRVLVYKIVVYLHTIEITAIIFIEHLPRQLVAVPWCAPRLMSTGFVTRLSLEIIHMPRNSVFSVGQDFQDGADLSATQALFTRKIEG